MLVQIAMNLLLDSGLERAEEEAQVGLDVHSFLVDCDLAVHAKALETDRVAVPAIVDRELVGQIAGQFISDPLSIAQTFIVGFENINSNDLITKQFWAAAARWRE